MRYFQFLLLLVAAQFPVSLQADEVPEKIRLAWEVREKKSERVELQWEGTATCHVSVEAELAGVPDPTFVPKVLKRKQRMVIDGDKSWRLETGEFLKVPLELPIENTISIFDGVCCVEILNPVPPLPTRATIYLTPAGARTINFAQLPLGWALRPLTTVLRGDEPTRLVVGEGELPHNKKKCLTLVQLPPEMSKKRYRRIFWIDPETADVLQMELHNRELLEEKITAEYGPAGNSRLPKSWSCDMYDGEGNILSSTTDRLDSITYPKAIAADQFEPKLSAGTQLTEVDGKQLRSYKIDAAGTKIESKP